VPSVAVLGPVVLPLAAAAVIALFALAGVNLGRVAAAIGAWSSVAALLAVWVPVRSSLELTLGPLGFGSSFDLRIDGVTVAFGLMISVPTALLLTLQPRPWQQAALSLLALAAAIAAVAGGGVVLTAIAGGTAATLAVVLLDTEDARAPRPSWAMLLAGWLGLSWVGVILQVGGGTAVYSAVPVASVTGPVFCVLAASAILVSSLFPWRTWPAALWSRPSLRAAGVTVATLYPLGFYILVRAYELGDGRYPHQLFNVALALIGIAAALAAGARAQAAPTRREFFGEVVPGAGGFALMAIAIGTPLGLASGLILLMTASAMVAALALLPDAAGIASLVAAAAAVGLPPGITFAARVVGIESTFEAGDFLGLIGIGGAAAWVIWMVGGARAVGLPGGRGHPLEETAPRASMVISLLALIAGAALAALEVVYADPVATEVMPSSAGTVAGGLTNVVTVSSVLPAVTLLAPVLVIGVVAYLLAGTSAIRTQARPALFVSPAAAVGARALKGLRSATVPEQYRSILSLRQVEAAIAGGSPVLWLGALVALGFAVTRF
jgi:formate hydrogenlyase subunit 3/multisubunit Na+/H+ antiporter MnhD subunit